MFASRSSFGYVRTASTPAAAFDATTLNFSGWWRASYSGSPWTGTASAGASSGRNLTAGSAPGIGAGATGFSSADFNGTTNYLNSAGVIENYLGSSTDFTIVCVIKADSAVLPSDVTPVYDCPQICSEAGGNMGFALSTGGFRLWHYPASGPPAVENPIASVSDWTAWHIVVGRKSGTNLEVSLDGGAWQTSTIGALQALGGTTLQVGINYSGVTFLKAQILEVGTMSEAISNTNATNYRSYAQSRYGI